MDPMNVLTYFKLIIPGLQPNVDVGAESQLETERLGEESAVRGGRHERTKWPRSRWIILLVLIKFSVVVSYSGHQ